jgi:hypothetical protein
MDNKGADEWTITPGPQLVATAIAKRFRHVIAPLDQYAPGGTN